MSPDNGDVLFKRDPRTSGWILAEKPQIIALLCILYIYVVKIGGPRFMKGRQPYEWIKPIIAIYNASMVLLNSYFMVAFLTRTYLHGRYNLLCQSIDFEARDENTMSLLTHCWWYFLVRIADFLDTVFFVLRKKQSHVSFLHVAHHVIVVFNGWYGLAYGSDGHGLFAVIFNSFVHVIMYSYYFLSLFGPSVQKYLWWKQYLTQFQLIQFVILTVHISLVLFIRCGYPLMHIFIGVPQGFFFLAMFMNFYLNSYKVRKPASALNRVGNKVK